MTLNDILQASGVGLCLILAIVWVIRRARRRDKDCECGCSDCPLSGKCDSKRKP